MAYDSQQMNDVQKDLRQQSESVLRRCGRQGAIGNQTSAAKFAAQAWWRDPSSASAGAEVQLRCTPTITPYRPAIELARVFVKRKAGKFWSRYEARHRHN
jgi:hypothetical protein